MPRGEASRRTASAAGRSSRGWRDSVVAAARHTVTIEGTTIQSASAAMVARAAVAEPAALPTHRAISVIANAANPL